MQALMTLYNQNEGLEGNRLMIQRKGNLPVVERSPEDRDREDLDVVTTVNMVRVPTAPPGLWGGVLPPSSAMRARGGKPGLVSLS